MRRLWDWLMGFWIVELEEEEEEPTEWVVAVSTDSPGVIIKSENILAVFEDKDGLAVFVLGYETIVPTYVPFKEIAHQLVGIYDEELN